MINHDNIKKNIVTNTLYSLKRHPHGNGDGNGGYRFTIVRSKESYLFGTQTYY